MSRSRWGNEDGFALVWWALFLGLVAFPLLVLTVEGGRYFRAAGDVQKAADAAAEAAVREVDIPHYLATGEVRFSGTEYVLAQDYFYKDPMRNLIMLDNHDFTRIYSTVGENMDKYKSAVAFLLTTRGIPQLYYLTEIAAPGTTSPHDGFVRQDFPGGWPSDSLNKFSAEGRTERENEAFNFTRTLLRYRKATPALQTGKLMQFTPVDGLYTYFRYDDAKTVMVVLNTANKDMELDTKRFAERMQGFVRAVNVVTGETVMDLSKLRLKKNSVLVLELGK